MKAPKPKDHKTLSKPIGEYTALEIAVYAVNCDNSNERIEEVERMIKTFANFLNNKWISAKDNPPEIDKYGWSEDMLCATEYIYLIGRVKNGVWIDMNNQPQKVILYMPVPEVTKELIENNKE